MTSGRISPPPSGDDRGPKNTPSSVPHSTDHGPTKEVADPSNPMANARILHASKHKVDGKTLLVFYNNQFRRWNGLCWPVLDEEVLRADIRQFFEYAYYMVNTSQGMAKEGFKPTKAKVSEIVDALKAVTIESDRDMPSWLNSGIVIPPIEILPMANGPLWIPEQVAMPPMSEFFNSYALPYEFDGDAAPPQRWHQFLDELCGDDTESIQLLQEQYGYLLTPDTSQQKILLVVGPMRSGKGTIGSVIRALLGDHNVAGPTLSGLCTNFGLQPLVDKPAAIISDARLGKGRDSATAVERLLSISGEDALIVDVKYKTPYTVKLPTRLIIMTNEVPALADSSGALASRFLTLRLTESFLGREDPTLSNKLLDELPGILLWALEGRQRLYERGFFIQPESGRAIIDDLVELSSPITAFVEDRCVLGPRQRVVMADLYANWRNWCDETNRNPGSNTTFSVELRTAYPQVESRRGSGTPRMREYVGIGLA